MQATAVRALPDPVLWHEGMLLAPQHFQQSHLRGEELLNYRLLAASPFAWGVRRLQVDLASLSQGTFHVTELEAVLPDGVVATVRTRGDLTLQADLTRHEAAARREELMVHLAVPAARADGEPLDGQLPRFDRVEDPRVPDDNTGDGEISITRLRPRLSLIPGLAAPDKYVSLPLARVGFRDGAFVLADFVPPVLAVVNARSEPSWLLAERCGDTAQRMREKATYFADRMAARRGEPSAAELHASVRALVAQLPRLEALLAMQRAHPLELYLAFCDAAGALAGLEGHVPPRFAPYDHNDLLRTFAPVAEFCAGVLDARQAAFTALPFEWRDTLFQVLPPAMPAPGAPLLVGVRAGALGEAAAEDWMRDCRIASESRMASVLDRRMSGARRRRVQPTGDLALAAGVGVTLFAVEPDPEHIIPGEPLQLALTEAERPARPAGLVLYTRNPVR